MMTPEQNLWREVLLVTVQDALSCCTSSGEPKSAKLKATQEARQYLTIANPDFEMVCTMADLDPIAVRDAITKRLLDAPSPKDLSATKRQASRDEHSGKLITHNGEAMRASAWAKRISASTQTIHARLKRGWSVDRTLNTPPRSLRRGVGSDFEEIQGTGGGTAAQETSNITFQDQTT